MIGVRLRQARVSSGLSLRELSSRIDNFVSAQMIHKYELNKARPSSEVLIRLAKALGIKVEYFFRPEHISVNLGQPSYRKRASVSEKRLKSLRAQAKGWIEKYLEVESLFGAAGSVPINLPENKFRRIKNTKDVEELAISLRNTWNIGLDSIENLTELLEDRGAKVVMLESERDFDGLSCWANNNIPVILIKKGLPGDRQRSNLAHELGHLIMEVFSKKDEEKAAYRFSGAFLVPRDVAYQELGQKRSHLDIGELNMLKKKYGMSMQQWIYRAEDLDIITPSKAEQMFRLFRIEGWYKKEPGFEVPSEEPGRFKRILFRAVSERLISPVRASELLGLPFNDFRKALGPILEKAYP